MRSGKEWFSRYLGKLHDKKCPKVDNSRVLLFLAPFFRYQRSAIRIGSAGGRHFARRAPIKMPVNQDAIISVCKQLAEQQNLRVCISESLKGAAIAGGCAFIGGIIGGPVGLAIGTLDRYSLKLKI